MLLIFQPRASSSSSPFKTSALGKTTYFKLSTQILILANKAGPQPTVRDSLLFVPTPGNRNQSPGSQIASEYFPFPDKTPYLAYVTASGFFPSPFGGGCSYRGSGGHGRWGGEKKKNKPGKSLIWGCLCAGTMQVIG